MAAELRDSSAHKDVLVPRMVQRLKMERGLSEDAAKLAVTTWALALDKTQGDGDGWGEATEKTGATTASEAEQNTDGRSSEPATQRDRRRPARPQSEPTLNTPSASEPDPTGAPASPVEEVVGMTVAELKEALPGLSRADRLALLDLERANRQRKSAIQAIETSLVDSRRTTPQTPKHDSKPPHGAPGPGGGAILGAVLKVAAVVSVLAAFGMSFAGVEDSAGPPWTSPYAIALILAAALGIAGYLVSDSFWD